MCNLILVLKCLILLLFSLIGISADCDSGYEASTMESFSTPSRQASLNTDADTQENFSDSFLQTPTHTTENLDITQDSIEVDDDNASTVSHLSELSGLSDLSGHEWKPMAQSFVWVRIFIAKNSERNVIMSFYLCRSRSKCRMVLIQGLYY